MARRAPDEESAYCPPSLRRHPRESEGGDPGGLTPAPSGWSCRGVRAWAAPGAKATLAFLAPDTVARRGTPASLRRRGEPRRLLGASHEFFNAGYQCEDFTRLG